MWLKVYEKIVSKNKILLIQCMTKLYTFLQTFLDVFEYSSIRLYVSYPRKYMQNSMGKCYLYIYKGLYFIQISNDTCI